MNYKRNTWLYDDIGMWKIRWILCAGVVILTTLVSVGIGISIPISTATCHEAANRVGKVTGHYRFLTGCYYRLPNGREVPQGNYPPKYIHLSP